MAAGCNSAHRIPSMLLHCLGNLISRPWSSCLRTGLIYSDSCTRRSWSRMLPPSGKRLVTTGSGTSDSRWNGRRKTSICSAGIRTTSPSRGTQQAETRSSTNSPTTYANQTIKPLSGRPVSGPTHQPCSPRVQLRHSSNSTSS